MNDRADGRGPAALSWRMKLRNRFVSVEFAGEIDENAAFGELRRRLSGAVVFHLAEVRRINSCGLREWLAFVRDLPRVTELVFSHCSPVIVAQLNMVSTFRGRARVRSFLAPYACRRCGNEEEALLDIETHFADRRTDAAPELGCGRCGAAMSLDDLPERYLSFLAESGNA